MAKTPVALKICLESTIAPLNGMLFHTINVIRVCVQIKK